MWRQSVWSSALAAKMASQFLKEGGLLQVSFLFGSVHATLLVTSSVIRYFGWLIRWSGLWCFQYILAQNLKLQEILTTSQIMKLRKYSNSKNHQESEHYCELL